jgi:membrane-bound ClpP family serine protease
MMMMQQAQVQQAPQMAQLPPSMVPAQVPQEYEEMSDESSDTSDSELELEKLGLSVPKPSLTEGLYSLLKDPMVAFVLFVLFSLIQFDNLLKPLLPFVISGGLYYLVLKGFLMGLVFLMLKLVIV